MSHLSQKTHVTTMNKAHAAIMLTLGIFAALLALAAPGAASAHAAIPFHAKLGHADPGIGAILNAAPTKVTLQFVEDTTPNGSDIVVYDEKGAKVTTGPATVSSSDAKTMTVNMQGNDSETYVVVFHTISADDGDAYADAYQFTVSKDATLSAGQQPDAAGDSISSMPPTSSASGVQPLIAALIGLVALIVGAAGGFFFARSQRAS